MTSFDATSEAGRPPGGTSSPGKLSTSTPHRGFILAICCLSVGVTGVDLTIVNVALPSIGQHFDASISSLQWTVDAYALVLACLLVFSGSMADRFGRRRIFQLGLTWFSVMSLLCALAPGIGWLIAFRALQAVGGSMLNPVAMSIIVSVYSDRKERARAIGIWGSVIGGSIAVGPIVGGALVDGINWRAVFWVAVPIGLTAIVLTHRFVPESKAARPRAFDAHGQTLIICLFASVIAAIIEAPRHGWTNPWVIALFTVATGALVGLFTVEPHRAEPLINMQFFQSPPFSGANVVSVVMSASLSGFLFLNTLYLQDVRNFSPLHAGLLIIPLAAAQAVAAIMSGRLVASQGPRISLIAGGALLTGGALLLLATTTHTTSSYLLSVYTVFGLGVGMISPTVTTIAMFGMPTDQTGVASALVASARQFGSAIGVAVVGSIIADTGAGFMASSRAAWVVLACCGLAALLLGVVCTSAWASAAAARNGERLDMTSDAGSDT